MGLPRQACLSIALVLVVVGCAAPVPRTDVPGGGTTAPSPGAPKRITMGIYGELTNVRSQVMTVTPGLTEVEQVINAGLAAIDDRGVMHPRLAESIPSLENGRWKLFDDGRMETTWTIRPDARWHDGTPFTSNDVYFTVVQVGKDRETPAFRHLMYDSIDAIETPDAYTA